MSRWTRHLALALTVLAVLPALVSAQQASDPDRPRSGVRWRNRPSLQIGEHVRIDLRLKLGFDVRTFDPEIGEDDFDFRVRRAGVNGEIGDHVEFEVERDLHETGRWRDVFVNWRTFRQFEVAAGRFKVPFGLEQADSITDIDFALRALVSTTVPPARDKGVMAHGRFLRRGLTYEFGVFEEDGDNGRLQEPQFVRDPDAHRLGPSFAGRVTATPLRPLAETLRTFRAGFAIGAADVPEGLNSLRGETVHGTTEFFEPVYVKGRRLRVGAELSYQPGPVGLQAEWMQAREQRLGQGLGDVDLSDLVTTGWYASATWLLTGESKAEFERPGRPLFRGGAGAVEVAARYEKLQFASAAQIGPAFRNPRAEHVLGNSDTAWTVGVNWYANRWVRLTVNGIHETFADAPRTPEPGVTGFWSGIGRLQIVF